MSSLSKLPHLMSLAAATLLVGALGATASASAAEDGKELFKTKIWPVLESSCTGCHGDKKQKGKLRLDSEEAFKKGGKEGVIFVAGKPADSKIIAAIKRGDDDTKMPPKDEKKLSAEQVADFEKWISLGAPWAK
jgi:mono/diheme cytochrome c family protein